MAFSNHIFRTLLPAVLLLGPGLLNAQSEASLSIPTGPAVGQKIPGFEAVDQLGRPQTFESLRGPKGLLLLFHRSADW